MTQPERTEEQLERIRDYVAALRSGKYAQTQNRLARDVNGSKSYCCEGVAFERYGEALGYELTWDDGSVEEGSSLMLARDPEYFVGSASNAPARFWDAMGLSTSADADEFSFVLPDGQLTLDDQDDYVQYATLNDDDLTFAQIADLIEWQFLSCPD